MSDYPAEESSQDATIRGTAVPIWSYFIVGLQIAIAMSVVCGLLTLWMINQRQFLVADGWFAGWKWAGLTTLSMTWGLVNLMWAGQAARNLNLLATFGHWVVVILSGFLVIGLHSISIAYSFNPGPQVRDEHAVLRAMQAASAEVESAEFAASARKGKAWFALVCITCHGPDGNGLDNLAPSLLTSQFVAQSTADEIAQVIKLGRPITHAQNQSGKPMPARGGDNALTDQRIADLAAYVLTFHNRTVPESVRVPQGDVTVSDVDPLTTFLQREINPTVRQLSIWALVFHGSYLLVVVAISMSVILCWLVGSRHPHRSAWLYISSCGWLSAAAIWLAIIGIFGWL